MAASDDESVWDSGPQYPDIWSQPSGVPVPIPNPQPSSGPAPEPTPELTGETTSELPNTPPLVAGVPTQQHAAGDGDDSDGDRRRGLLVAAAAVLGLIAIGVVVWLLVGGGDSDDDLQVAGSVPTLPETAPPTVATTLAVITSPPVTTVPTPTSPPFVEVPVITPETSPATIPATVPATAPPTAPATTLAAPAGPTVTITSRIGRCNFGDDCLIAGFTIERFDVQPTEFICEFADGSRYPFRFDSDGVAYACSTAAADGTITIEVAGVRSETVTRP